MNYLSWCRASGNKITTKRWSEATSFVCFECGRTLKAQRLGRGSRSVDLVPRHKAPYHRPIAT